MRRLIRPAVRAVRSDITITADNHFDRLFREGAAQRDCFGGEEGLDRVDHRVDGAGGQKPVRQRAHQLGDQDGLVGIHRVERKALFGLQAFQLADGDVGHLRTGAAGGREDGQAAGFLRHNAPGE